MTRWCGIKNNSLIVVGWNARSYDTIIKDTMKLKARAVKLFRPGKIVLMHDRLPRTIETISAVIPLAKENGYEFDILSEKNV